jgi:hypothetical protein
LTWCDDWLNCIRIVAKIIKWSCGLTSWTILAVSDVTSLARLSRYHHNCYLVMVMNKFNYVTNKFLLMWLCIF